MSAAAGWYADPSGTHGQLRWWDGAAWTEHVTAAPAPRSGNGLRTGIIIVAVVGAIVLALIGFIGVAAVRFGEFDTSGVTADTRTNVTVRTEAQIGDRLTATIPSDGAFQASFTVERPGTVTFDVRGEDGFDSMLEVIGPSGESLGQNDDREVDAPGCDVFDPYLALELAPGRYTVFVEGWAGEGGSFELRID